MNGAKSGLMMMMEFIGEFIFVLGDQRGQAHLSPSGSAWKRRQHTPGSVDCPLPSMVIKDRPWPISTLL